MVCNINMDNCDSTIKDFLACQGTVNVIKCVTDKDTGATVCNFNGIKCSPTDDNKETLNKLAANDYKHTKVDDSN